MVRETRLSVDQLIYPLFICEGANVREEIASMPGQFRHSLDRLPEILERVRELSVPAVLLFGVPGSSAKDEKGSAAYDPEGIVPRALRLAKTNFPDLLLVADVCLCEYTDHGHCGLVAPSGTTYRVENDPTLPLLARCALEYARSGADVVAPSDMMDGRVGAIRRELDGAEFSHLPILSYAVKYASAFYGPFREAAESAPRFGDRRSYQMNPANIEEALKEVEHDIEEGADMVMVKPAMPYLDVLAAVRSRVRVPVAAYQVSGEYSALCAAFQSGWLDRRNTLMESLVSIRRAGADLIVTYFALEAAELLRVGAWE